MNQFKNSTLYEEIKSDLLDQLERSGTHGKYYTDLVSDYMGLWVTKCLLIEHIEQNGVAIAWNNGGGQKGTKKNDSVDQVIKVNAQMMKILDGIGIKPVERESTQGGEGDAL